MNCDTEAARVLSWENDLVNSGQENGGTPTELTGFSFDGERNILSFGRKLLPVWRVGERFVRLLPS